MKALRAVTLALAFGAVADLAPAADEAAAAAATAAVAATVEQRLLISPTGSTCRQCGAIHSAILAA